MTETFKREKRWEKGGGRECAWETVKCMGEGEGSVRGRERSVCERERAAGGERVREGGGVGGREEGRERERITIISKQKIEKSNARS